MLLLCWAGTAPAGREKADPINVGSVGAPMAGKILEVIAKPGAPFNSPDDTVTAAPPFTPLAHNALLWCTVLFASNCTGRMLFVSEFQGSLS